MLRMTSRISFSYPVAVISVFFSSLLIPSPFPIRSLTHAQSSSRAACHARSFSCTVALTHIVLTRRLSCAILLMRSCSHAPPVMRDLMHSCSHARSYRRSVSPDVPNAITRDLPFDSNVPVPGAMKEIGIEICALTQPTLQSGLCSDSAGIQTIPLIHFLCAAVLYEIKYLFGCIRK